MLHIEAGSRRRSCICFDNTLDGVSNQGKANERDKGVLSMDGRQEVCIRACILKYPNCCCCAYDFYIRPPLFEFIPHARIMMRLVEKVYHKFLVTAQ